MIELQLLKGKFLSNTLSSVNRRIYIGQCKLMYTQYVAMRDEVLPVGMAWLEYYSVSNDLNLNKQ